MDKRFSLKIDISEDEWRKFSDLVDEHDLKQGRSLARILVWFNQQDDVTQATILGTIPESIQSDVAQLHLQRLAAKAAPDTPGKRPPTRRGKRPPDHPPS